MGIEVLGGDSGMTVVSTETAAALQTRYTFLTNAIPDLEKQVADLQAKVAQAQVDYDKACGLKNDALDAREAAVSDRETKAGLQENNLNLLAASLNDKQVGLETSAQEIADAHTNVQNLIAQYEDRYAMAKDKQKELEALQDQIQQDSASLAASKDDFEAYRAKIELDITDRLGKLADSEAASKVLIEQYNGLMEELLRKLSDLDSQKPSIDAAAKAISDKEQALTDKINAVAAQSQVLDNRSSDLDAREALLDSKEQDLKAIKAQQDKRESKIKELIANCGLQIKDIVL